MPIPASIASLGLLNCCSTPLTVIVPSSGRCIPYRIFISVDLPAPFSPTSAWISPGTTEKLIRSLAMTPGKRLVMSDSDTAGAVSGGGCSMFAAVSTWLLLLRGPSRADPAAARGAGHRGLPGPPRSERLRPGRLQ